MKTTKISLTVIILSIGMLFPGSVFSQSKKTDTLKVKTSAVCESCKTRIEEGLAFVKGVKESTLDIDTKIATVVYDPAKTTPDKIRTAISKLGYDADDVPADKAAYAKLPACCKKDSGKH